MEPKESVKPRSLSESKYGICMVCCENMDCFSVGNCDHPICFKCSARMRVKAQQTYCPSCRSELEQVVFCQTLKNFGSFHLQKLLSNRKFGILFENGSIKKKFEALISFSCVTCGIDVHKPFASLDQLKSHVRKAHGKQFCAICIKNLSVFPSELKLYTQKELVRHRREGDSDEKSHRGHPECRFCDERYFDNDGLLLHLRKSHFWCHFCEHDGKQDYYDVYDSLRRHFSSTHYLCDEGDCWNEKFTSVFRDKIDFQAHKLAHHGKKLNKFQAKEARKVDLDLSLFGGRQSNQSSSVVTGADYEEVHRTESRREGNRRQNNNNSNNGNHRYHREQNGTLNYYDYEDIEKDRKKFLGKPKRHEAEEVDKERTRVERAIAASASMSSSEPNIARACQETRLSENRYNDDDVIGFSEHINSNETATNSVRRKPDHKPSAKSGKKVESPVKEQQIPPTKQQSQPPPQQEKRKEKVVDVADFPSLPGTKQYIPSQAANTPVEDFPALPSANKAKLKSKAKANAPSLSSSQKQTESFAQMNGIQVVKMKSRKKGKTKIKQTDVTEDSKDYPTLGGGGGGGAAPAIKSAQKPSQPVMKENKNVEKKNGSSKEAEEKVSRPPPPGLHSNGSTKQSVSLPPGLTEINNSYPALGKATKKPPPGLKAQQREINSVEQRNIRLMGMLQVNLDDVNLNIFKNVSGQFRRGNISGKEYYGNISELLGDNFKHIFSELVNLLPDEEKRQELLRVHNDFKIKLKQREDIIKSATVPDYSKPQRWGATNTSTTAPKVEDSESRCEQCGITMKTEDALEHMETAHREAFPALPVAAKKKKNYSFSPSARHTKSVPVKSAWEK